MVGPDTGDEEDPVIQPRVIRFLKDRPRLIDRGFRRDILSEMEENVKQRRKPTNVAQRAANRATEEAKQAASRPMAERVKNRLNSANEGILNRL